MKKNVLLLGALVAGLTLGGVASCGEELPKVSTYFDVTVEGNRTTLAVGEKVQLNVTMYGTTSNEVIFKSSNERTLKVSETGLVEALGAGGAKITVTSKSNPELTKEISLGTTLSLGQRNPQLQEMADSIEAYNYGNGVRYNGGIKVDIGELSTKYIVDIKLKDISIPLTAEVQTSEETGTNVHLRTDFNNLIQIDAGSMTDLAKGMVFPILKKTFAGLLLKDFDSYLVDADCADYKYLDLYTFNNLDYYTALTRNFGTEDAPEYRPFAVGQSNYMTLLSPLGSTLLGALTGGSEEEAPEEGTGQDSSLDLGLDLGSLLSKDGLLNLTSTLYGFLDDETGEDYTKLTLSNEVLNMINPILSGIGGEIPLDLMGFQINGLYIPTELTEVGFLVENKAEGENKFSKFEFFVKALDQDGMEYDFVNIHIDKPEELGANYFSDMKTDIENYNAANTLPINSGSSDTTTTVIDAIKTANTLTTMQDTYGVTETSKIRDTMKSLLATKKNVDNEYVKDLMYPLENRLASLDYFKKDKDEELPKDYSFINGYADTKTVGDDQTGRFLVDYFIGHDQGKINSIEYRSADNEKISIDENGIFKGVNKIYSGSVANGNVKSTNSDAKVYAKVKYLDEAGLEQEKEFNSTITYNGSRATFENTRSTLVEAEGFDKETHTLNINSNSTYDLKSLVKLPEGATEAEYAFTSKDKVLATVDSETGALKTLTARSEDTLGNLRNLAGVTLKLTYKLDGETVTDNHVFYVQMNDYTEAILDETKLVEGVEWDEETRTIVAQANTSLDLDSLFKPAAEQYDEDSLKMIYKSKVDSNLYNGTDKKVLSPYYNSMDVDSDGNLLFTDTSSKNSQYVEFTYKVNGVDKVERFFFNFKVTGEAKQINPDVVNYVTDSHYNKETNTLTLKKSDFVEEKADPSKPESENILTYQIDLVEGAEMKTLLDVKDNKIADKVNVKVGKETVYKLQFFGTGKTTMRMYINKDGKNHNLYCYLVITD